MRNLNHRNRIKSKSSRFHHTACEHHLKREKIIKSQCLYAIINQKIDERNNFSNFNNAPPSSHVRWFNARGGILAFINFIYKISKKHKNQYFPNFKKFHPLDIIFGNIFFLLLICFYADQFRRINAWINAIHAMLQ